MLANLVNGKEESCIPITDRAFQYGDGVFETLRISNRQLTLWPQHRKRLLDGCSYLGIPLATELLESELQRLLRENPSDGVIKILVSRGSGGRGYQPPAACESLRVVQFHPLPAGYTSYGDDGVNATVCNHLLSINSRLSAFKHLCRLDQVLASRELSDRFAEGIMQTDRGLVIEGTRSNLFVALGNRLLTPCLQEAGVQGVMRQYLLERFETDAEAVEVSDISLTDLADAAELFFCNSVFGVWPVTDLLIGNKSLQLPVGRFSQLALGFVDDAFSFRN